MDTQHDCSTELKQANLAVTPARIAALKLFESENEPKDALFLVDSLSKKGTDRVTAFRIINIFVEKGLLRKIELGEGKARYELASRGDHHHFFCRSCESIQDVDDMIVPTFIKKLEETHNFLITDHSLEFFGICETCLNKKN